MRQRMQKNQVSKTAIQAAEDFKSFFSDTEKNENGLDPLMEDNNLSKLYAEEIKPTTPNEFEGKSGERKVKFDIQINRLNNCKPQEISFEEIDKYNFNKGFIEFILTEKYVHLYFDFDSISSEDDFINVINCLESLLTYFRPFRLRVTTPHFISRPP